MYPGDIMANRQYLCLEGEDKEDEEGEGGWGEAEDGEKVEK